MTATNHPYTRPRGRSSLHAAGRQFARLGALVQWFRIQVAEIATAGQLGPDPETEIGRQTGARV